MSGVAPLPHDPEYLTTDEWFFGTWLPAAEEHAWTSEAHPIPDWDWDNYPLTAEYQLSEEEERIAAAAEAEGLRKTEEAFARLRADREAYGR